MKKYGFIIVYLTISALIFAFSMGITLGNLVLNVALAFFLFKFDFINLYQFRILSFITLLGINAASIYLALQHYYTIVDLNSMLNLDFELTNNMIYAIVIIGGLLIMLINDMVVKTLEKKQA